MTGPEVTVHYRDPALAALVADAARRVPGVVRLHRRPAAGLVGAVARGRVAAPDADTSAVELGRDVHGTLEVSVRLVSTLRPSPLQVVAAVGHAVRGRLAEIGQDDVLVEVTVTDVRI